MCICRALASRASSALLLGFAAQCGRRLAPLAVMEFSSAISTTGPSPGLTLLWALLAGDMLRPVLDCRVASSAGLRPVVALARRSWARGVGCVPTAIKIVRRGNVD